VGNEYILNTAGTNSLTSPTYMSAVQTIQGKIQEVNSTVLSMGLSKHLPIGTSDAGSILSKSLAGGIDFFMANVHP
jgi:glucan 1,3-beta-glucosidase